MLRFSTDEQVTHWQVAVVNLSQLITSLQHEEKFVDAAISRKDEEISRDRYRIPA